MCLKYLLCTLFTLTTIITYCPPIKKIDKQRSVDKNNTVSIESRFEDFAKGVLILGAYGDAQGRITEFWTDIRTLQYRRPNLSGTNYPAIPSLRTLITSQPYARFTDDTHMSLYLTHALLETDLNPIEIILNSITSNFINWRHADQNERAPGNACIHNTTTLQQLKNNGIKDITLWSRTLLPSLIINQPNNGLRTLLFNKEGGSGALMRNAPVTLLYSKDQKMAELLSVAQGILTHTDSGSRAACAGYNAALLAILIHEDSRALNNIFDTAAIIAEQYDNRPYVQPYNPEMYAYGSSHFSKNGCAAMCRKAKEYYKAGLQNKPYHEVLDEFRGWGAAEALAAALYIFVTWNNDPYVAMTIAINRTPGDSDTIAKIVGELFGAQYGYNAIVENFKQHGLNLDQEIKYLENINNLPEYSQHFTHFKDHAIFTFEDLAIHITKL